MRGAEVERRLRERGMSLTPQRRAILRFLDGNRDHPTAADVLAAVTRDFPMSSRATVYNTLALLVEVGALGVEREGDEARFDPNTAPHHHLRCPRCGRLEDVPADAVEVRWHGEAREGRVTFQGVCEGCEGAGAAEAG